MARPRTREARAELPSDQRRLSNKLRSYRETNNLTLEQVARMTGVSVGTLSKLENDRIALRFETLAKLFNALDVSMAGLDTDCPRPFTDGAHTVNRLNSEDVVETAQYQYNILSGELSHKAIFPVRIVVKARSLDDFEEWNQHHGEEFIYVLSGTVKFYMEKREPIILRRGESVHFDSSIRHALASHSKDDAVVLSLSHGVAPVGNDN
ncbi:helix-turn-helix domain-containing protein [Phenylobacterium sp.]|uniref:helix-turn-helix domain-containing protein n=1 Tax=Phenylobacterium sp. TaxID=1871053 RepID=UPI002FC86727